MIALISGLLASKSPTYVIIDARGMGYRVFVSLTTFYELPDAGQPVTLHIHTHVRQDAIHLFGFHTTEERDIFQLLLAVNGIGPKLAVNILSGIAAGELLKAVSQGNLKRLVTIPGVGKKILWDFINAHKQKAFESFQDIQTRVNVTPIPILAKRIIEELETVDEKYRLFTRPPPSASGS